MIDPKKARLLMEFAGWLIEEDYLPADSNLMTYVAGYLQVPERQLASLLDPEGNAAQLDRQSLNSIRHHAREVGLEVWGGIDDDRYQVRRGDLVEFSGGDLDQVRHFVAGWKGGDARGKLDLLQALTEAAAKAMQSRSSRS